MIKTLSFTLILTACLSFPAYANNQLPLIMGKTIVNHGFDVFSELINNTTLSVKKGESYDESRDPAFQSGGPQDGPKHGYFAVPLIVISLAGILIYFSKND